VNKLARIDVSLRIYNMELKIGIISTMLAALLFSSTAFSMTPGDLVTVCEVSASGLPVEEMSKLQLMQHTMCLFYSRGILEGVGLGAWQALNTANKDKPTKEVQQQVDRFISCFPDRSIKDSNKLLAETIIKYIKKHPNDMSDSTKVPYLVWKAMLETYPCE